METVIGDIGREGVRGGGEFGREDKDGGFDEFGSADEAGPGELGRDAARAIGEIGRDGTILPTLPFRFPSTSRFGESPPTDDPSSVIWPSFGLLLTRIRVGKLETDSSNSRISEGVLLPPPLRGLIGIGDLITAGTAATVRVGGEDLKAGLAIGDGGDVGAGSTARDLSDLPHLQEGYCQ